MTGANPGRRFITRLDGVIIAALIACSFAGSLVYGFGAGRGKIPDRLTIRFADGNRRTYEIRKGQVQDIPIVGRCGPMIIEFDRDGRIRIAASACPSQNCVRTGWVRSSECIVCVPNGVIVNENVPDEAAPDGITR